MDVGQKLSNASRTLSNSSLKDKLSKLAVTPLRPIKIHSNIEFAPARIPRKRRMQMLAVAIWSVLIALTTVLFLFLCSMPSLWPFLVAYQIWITWIDQSPEHGGRTSQWFRELAFWRYFADYYPASLKKEADLPPDRPYVFGYHPHELQGGFSIVCYRRHLRVFSAAFPGIKPHLLTLASNFHMPFYRDIILAMGICSVSKRSCSNILKSGPGSAITIVVGGAAESLSAQPGTADLTLRKRLGFIKVAIQHGADLVPVFSFGENDIYEQMPNQPGTTIHSLQKRFQSVFGFTLPLFHGRGLLNYNIGLMPYRRQIVAVIGNPIHVKQCDMPDIEEITRIQRMYIEELTRIWNTYKDQFAKSRTRELNIVE
ncbi:diacylglycerol acyltransferase-domain-containing protein [Rhodocollybia butyracea]|uniref:Diacylglycerol O-acyltransferase n=1 Tax=Rhodocollybia butyracea TaxID=206335 RepID=A0A9P5PS48_9AGAR|nr:diacylglycerol acyltransferase-domain-containing protein [Rhodocollybia butyracea]